MINKKKNNFKGKFLFRIGLEFFFIRRIVQFMWVFLDFKIKNGKIFCII